MDTFWQGLKYGVRTLAKSPAFAVIAICYIPSRRTMRVDPIVALRYE